MMNIEWVYICSESLKGTLCENEMFLYGKCYNIPIKVRMSLSLFIVGLFSND